MDSEDTEKYSKKANKRLFYLIFQNQLKNVRKKIKTIRVA